jgi:hypothetical protein
MAKGNQTSVLQQVGRVAFRHEGDYWNCYYALLDTMQGAILLASIHMSAVSGPPNEGRKRAFMDLGKGIANDILREAGHPALIGTEQPAHEHERAGHG